MDTKLMQIKWIFYLNVFRFRKTENNHQKLVHILQLLNIIYFLKFEKLFRFNRININTHTELTIHTIELRCYYIWIHLLRKEIKKKDCLPKQIKLISIAFWFRFIIFYFHKSNGNPKSVDTIISQVFLFFFFVKMKKSA